MATRHRQGLPGARQETRIQPDQYEIIDGDTLALVGEFRIAGRDRLHLHGVDAPELEQTLQVTEDLSGSSVPLEVAYQRIARPAVGATVAIGTLAQQALTHLCDGQPLDVSNLFWDDTYTEEDNTARLYGDVRAHSRQYGASSRTQVNTSMIYAGLAMVHTYHTQQHQQGQTFARQRSPRLGNLRSGFWTFLQGDDEDFSPAAWRRAQQAPDPMDQQEPTETTDTPLIPVTWDEESGRCMCDGEEMGGHRAPPRRRRRRGLVPASG